METTTRREPPGDGARRIAPSVPARVATIPAEREPLRPNEAIILAAGRGSRLAAGHDAPKPLIRVAGLTLLERAIRNCVRAGVASIVVVVGHGRAVMEPAIADLSARYRVPIRAAMSRHWKLGNGASVLAGVEHVRGPFYLMMCDHLLEAKLFERLRERAPAGLPLSVVVDREPSRVPDLHEATKVRLGGRRVTGIGKQLDPFDAVDTGLFLVAGRELRDALFEAASAGRHTLSDGVRLLAARGRVGWVDSGDGRWFDVDTPADLALAQSAWSVGPRLHSDREPRRW